MKIIATFSGGKDSLATLIWLRNNGYQQFETVFCDTGWENKLTYDYINEIDKKLGLNIKVLKSEKYIGMIDLAQKRGRFPSSQRRFCTSELKNIPMLNYLLNEVKDDFVIVQGIRKAESESRSKMNMTCDYFKGYKEPIGIDKNGKSKYHTYKRKFILNTFDGKATDVFRPIFEWSGQEVMDYIVDNGFEPNPLYKMGMKRVGCFPCMMCSLSEIHQISQRFPERITEISEAEEKQGRTFFSYDKVPDKYCKTPTIKDVVKYANAKYNAGELFDDYQPTSCMSYYGLCE